MAKLTQDLLLDYLEKEFSSEDERLEAFFELVGDIFANVIPPVPGISQTVKSNLSGNIRLNFSDGFLFFNDCFNIGKIQLAPHIPPPTGFILISSPNQKPSKPEVSSFISKQLKTWISTGSTQAGVKLVLN